MVLVTETGNVVTCSWEDIMDRVTKLAKMIEHHQHSRLVAVAKGGIVPVGLLCQHSGTTQVDVISVRVTDIAQRFVFAIEEAPRYWYDKYTDVLLIDEVCDTGETVRFLRSTRPGLEVACLFVKPLGKPFVNYWVEEVPQDTWIVFPWELNP